MLLVVWGSIDLFLFPAPVACAKVGRFVRWKLLIRNRISNVEKWGAFRGSAAARRLDAVEVSADS